MFHYHAGTGHSLLPLGKRAMMEMGGAMGSHGHMGDGGMMFTMGKDGEKPDQIQMPGWFWLACLAIFVVFFPVMLYICYSLNSLIPSLAMIEDPAPPAYEPLATGADDAEAPSPAKSSPVTASIRQTTQLLRSIGGFSSLFRGFWCAFFASIAMSAAQSFFAAFIPTVWLSSILAPLPAVLITLPLTTAWTHIIMSAPKSAAWYRRLPPTRKTFSALWRPAFVMWAAIAIASVVPQGMLRAFGVTDELLRQNPNYSALGWKVTVPTLVGLILSLCLIVPAHLIFTRVQASLLPLEDEPIVAFDRSFGGAIEPEVVGGKGYATLADAWNTFSRDNWIRLIKLYAKVFGISILMGVVMAAVFIPVFVVARKHATVIPGGN